jgi:hypothetical protein
MGGLDEWLPPAYLASRLGSEYRNRLTDRAGLYSNHLLPMSRSGASSIKTAGLTRYPSAPILRLDVYPKRKRAARTASRHPRLIDPPNFDLRPAARARNRPSDSGDFPRRIARGAWRALPALQRLEARGWIVAEWGTSANNRKARFYKLTKAGRKQLTRETTKWRRLATAIGRILGPEAEG